MPPTPWTTASTRSCWRARRRPAAYPARAVQTLDAIIRDAEAASPLQDADRRMADVGHDDHAQALCEAA